MKPELKAVERVLTGSRAEAATAARELADSLTGQALLSVVAQASGITLSLRRDGQIIERLLVLPGTDGVTLSGVVPGDYTLWLSTGRLLWQRNLAAKDLLVALAFPDEALPAVAQTAAFSPVPTVTDTVADGALTVRVYPGRESGGIRFVLL